jgi:hypothetical protein
VEIESDNASLDRYKTAVMAFGDGVGNPISTVDAKLGYHFNHLCWGVIYWHKSLDCAGL